MRGFRVAAGVIVAATVAGALTGCGSGTLCSPLEPSPAVTASFQPEADAIAAVSGVQSVTPRLFQPDDRHCVSRDYLQTAPWAATYDVHVAAEFTDAQAAEVRAALGASTATMTAAPGADVAEWSLYFGAESDPGPFATPDLIDAVTSDSERIALVTEAARLPDVTTAQLTGSSMTVRVRQAGSMAGAAAWLRAAPAPGHKWVYAGQGESFSVGIDVSDERGVSDEMIATAAEFAETHPLLDDLSVSADSVSGVLPTRAEAQELVAAFEQTEADSKNQQIRAWWPDGNGTELSGQVGSAVATR